MAIPSIIGGAALAAAAMCLKKAYDSYQKKSKTHDDIPEGAKRYHSESEVERIINSYNEAKSNHIKSCYNNVKYEYVEKPYNRVKYEFEPEHHHKVKSEYENTHTFSRNIGQLGDLQLKVGTHFKQFRLLAERLLGKINQVSELKNFHINFPKAELRLIDGFIISATDYLTNIVQTSTASMSTTAAYSIYGEALAFTAALEGKEKSVDYVNINIVHALRN